MRPSRGDYGIDVLVPALDGSGQFDVYQVKKYAGTRALTAKQKRDIEESFKRLLIGLAQKNIPVRNWYLTAPTDLTVDSQLEWFEALPETIVESLFGETDKKTGAPRLRDCEEITRAFDRRAVLTAPAVSRSRCSSIRRASRGG